MGRGRGGGLVFPKVTWLDRESFLNVILSEQVNKSAVTVKAALRGSLQAGIFEYLPPQPSMASLPKPQAQLDKEAQWGSL